MAAILVQDKFIDVTILNDRDLQKAKVYTLLQSGFHKILYLKEKLVMRRLFQKDLLANYVDFTCIREVRIG